MTSRLFGFSSFPVLLNTKAGLCFSSSSWLNWLLAVESALNKDKTVLFKNLEESESVAAVSFVSPLAFADHSCGRRHEECPPRLAPHLQRHQRHADLRHHPGGAALGLGDMIRIRACIFTDEAHVAAGTSDCSHPCFAPRSYQTTTNEALDFLLHLWWAC